MNRQYYQGTCELQERRALEVLAALESNFIEQRCLNRRGLKKSNDIGVLVKLYVTEITCIPENWNRLLLHQCPVPVHCQETFRYLGFPRRNGKSPNQFLPTPGVRLFYQVVARPTHILRNPVWSHFNTEQNSPKALPTLNGWQTYLSGQEKTWA